jgi:hypothetical protein
MLDLRFKRSEKGKVEWAAVSPFAKDESLMLMFKSWARADLNNLTVQKTTDWVNHTLLSDWLPAQLKEQLNIKSYPVSQHIVRRWMRDAGFRYEAYRKCYYVDRHEDTDVVADRTDYIPKCFAMELREHVWVQLTLVKYNKAIEFKHTQCQPKRKKRESSGAVKLIVKTAEEKLIQKFHDSFTHHYINEGVPYVEVHVDALYSYSDLDDEMGLPKLDSEATGGLGGWLSCRIFPCVRPVAAIGQDEVIFHPSTMNEMVWMVDGITQLRSKGGTGNGKMVSGTKTRMHGFAGPKLKKPDFDLVNEARQGKYYPGYAAEAARNLLGSSAKKPLTESPFVRMIDYGAQKDGYWNANHMLVQVADCMDFWNAMTQTSYILPLWEFDHSSGHDCERQDGLTTTPQHLKMTWGKGRQMRESVLTDGCVGTIQHKDRVFPGCTYSHSFLPSDEPPTFYDGNVPPPKHDVTHERNVLEKDKNKDDLVRDLEAEGINSKGNVPVLKDRCRQAGISLKKSLDNLTPGYVGKPKGAVQIAYERGFIDAQKKNASGKVVSWEGMIIKTPNDNVGVQELPGPHHRNQQQGRARKKPKKRRDLSTSLRWILANCRDFKEEKTKLDCLVEQLGGMVRMTPKVHPEIAGVGIEYDWGYAKLKYRKEINDGLAQHLEANVRRALCPEETLTLKRTRKFARKAREYKLTYFFLIRMTELQEAQGDTTEGNTSAETERLAKETIESITKAFKAHRCALDSDYAFIRTA